MLVATDSKQVLNRSNLSFLICSNACLAFLALLRAASNSGTKTGDFRVTLRKYREQWKVTGNKRHCFSLVSFTTISTIILSSHRHWSLGTCPWRSQASPWPSCWVHWSSVKCSAAHSDAAAEYSSQLWSLPLTAHPAGGLKPINEFRCISTIFYL